MENHNDFIQIGDYVKDLVFSWSDWYLVWNISEDESGKYLQIYVRSDKSDTRYYFSGRKFLIRDRKIKRVRAKKGFGKWISKIESKDV